MVNFHTTFQNPPYQVLSPLENIPWELAPLQSCEGFNLSKGSQPLASLLSLSWFLL